MKPFLRLLPSLFVAAMLMVNVTSHAATFQFDSDPFAGSTALTTPGRQIVGNELEVLDFNIATDVFAFNSAAFGIGSLQFASGEIGSIPTSGVNLIVLQTFDSDANAETPFLAGSAANLIADRIISPGPGFFIYFNSGLDLPRLIYSTDLSENTADLKVLARITDPDFAGQAGRDAMANFSAANFQIVQSVPESGSNLILLLVGAALLAGRRVFRRS